MKITTQKALTDSLILVQTISSEDGLPLNRGKAIYTLANETWPPEPGNTAPSLQETINQWQQQQTTHFVIAESDTEAIVAHALIFRREIKTTFGPLSVGALATVCVHPAHRGKGWGAEVVRAAFDYLPELGAKVSLFQTGVPQFYEKLGGRLITNRIINGDNPENPFWDTYVMIYPADFDWPEETIDLQGKGY